MLPFQMGRIRGMLSHSALPVNLNRSSAGSSSASLKFLATRRNGLMLAVEMSLLASFMNLAGPDLIVILLIVLVLFGAKKLPELARGMGQAVKEFQKAKDEFNDELHKAGKSDAQVAKPDAKPVESTVARTDSQGASNVTASQPSAAVTPGDKADQV
jgi:sec-independent protein translocase protein TatA